MRERTYALLAERMGEFVSGEALSAILGVSRAAVFKHIRAFREDGADIVSINNRGHCLRAPADRLKSEYVRPFLRDPDVFDIRWKESAVSTNDEAKALALRGAREFTCVTAEEQTGGRGRRGRAWVSPLRKGVYCTLILRPRIPAQRVSGVTVAAALAVCGALRSLGLDARIKWPNDVLIGGKKVCGILTESAVNMDDVEYVVCGMGINVNLGPDDVMDGIEKTATSLLMETGAAVSRTRLLASLLDAFCGEYRVFIKEGVRSLVGRYSAVSALHGRTLTVEPDGETGVFYGFDEDAALLLNVGGRVRRYLSGEVSLKGFYDG